MRIKELRDFNNIQQKELAGYLGISPNTLSQYENGRREPGIETVAKIAEYFNVSTDYIYQISNITTCKKCCLTYDPMNLNDKEVHDELHRNWEAAARRHGKIYSDHVERERIKAQNRKIAEDEERSLEERYTAQLEIFRCLFSRSLNASNYGSDHVDFPAYVSMLLNQGNFKKAMKQDLYDKCVENFGTSRGIPDGTCYNSAIDDAPSTVAAHFDGDEFSEEQLDRIKAFAAFIKSEEKK